MRHHALKVDPEGACRGFDMLQVRLGERIDAVGEGGDAFFGSIRWYGSSTIARAPPAATLPPRRRAA
jgi:hypothetical protein